VKYLICSKFIMENLKEKFVILLCTCLLAMIAFDVNGQNKPLDNWDLEVVGHKNLQSENYLSFEKKGEYNSSVFNALLRYGISKNVELQIDLEANRYGTIFGDVSNKSSRIGIKAFLMDESKFLPGISVISSINLTVQPEFIPLLPSLNILLRKGLVENFVLTGNCNIILDEQTGNWGYDIAANLDINLTQWWTTYIGVKGERTFPPKGDNAFYDEYIEMGMLFWVVDGVRIYTFYDFGLDDNSEDVMNIGLLYRFQ